MKLRISLLAVLVLSIQLAAAEQWTPLRIAVIHVASAAALPVSCTDGVSPDVLTDDELHLFVCTGGAYVEIPAVASPNYGLCDLGICDPYLEFTPISTGGGFRFWANSGGRYFECKINSTTALVTCTAYTVGARWLFIGTSADPSFEVTGNFKATTYQHLTITDNGANTLNIATGATLAAPSSATVSGTNTGDETAARVRSLGFFDTTNDGTGSGLDADLLDGFHSSSFQPLDTDLSSIAALSTTAFGRGLLDDADGAEARTTVGALYALPINAWGGVSGLIPFDATTYFMGGTGPILTTTTNAVRKIYFRKAGIVRVAELSLYCMGTAGSNENVSAYFRLNDTTDSLIATVGTSAAERNFTNTAINVSVASGDFFEIKVVAPTWATNPTVCYFSGYVLVE